MHSDIKSFIQKNTAIVKLNLMCNDIETLGAQYIAASLHVRLDDGCVDG